MTLNGETVNTVPEKKDYKRIEVTCDNGATGKWDTTEWGITVTNINNVKTKCAINFVYEYTEDILNGADPVLADNLIPVKISDTGVVTKADMANEWYNYGNKVWANAVILEDETITYNNGDVIPEENIESYFVWIPRYSYQLWELGEYSGLTTVDSSKVHTIDVKFGTRTTSDAVDGECTTPGVSGESGNCEVGDYMTHPAFTSFGSNGIWVGKFETGYKGATNEGGARSNTNDSSKIEIKPNVYSWRSIQVANAYSASRTYKADLNSHMMKNTEWGAVAYLQHSAYGSQASVRINNNSNYITGYAAINEPTCGYTNSNEECNKYEGTALKTDGTYTINYLNTASVVASTTGNYSGVYDMSGGAWEYMMGVLADTNGNPMSGRNNSNNSGFKGTYGCPGCDSDDSSITANTSGADFPTDTRYYDLYKYGTSDKAYNNRIMGDATGEMGPFGRTTYGSQTRQISSWYADEAWFVSPGGPWFVRGGYCLIGAGAGVFRFANGIGHAIGGGSFRVVLAI